MTQTHKQRGGEGERGRDAAVVYPWFDTHTYIHTYTHTYIHTHTHTYIHTHTHLYTHTHTYIHTQSTHTEIEIHREIDTHTHYPTHTHTHVHLNQPPSPHPLLHLALPHRLTQT